jgi:hypothetical protein
MKFAGHKTIDTHLAYYMSNESLSHAFQKDQFQTGEKNPTAENSKNQTPTAIPQENSTASHPQVGKTAVTRGQPTSPETDEFPLAICLT